MPFHPLAIFLFLTLLLSNADARSYQKLRVIDGDSIVLSGERIRLEGIDAPEIKQTCNNNGKEWHCGKTATNFLRKMLIGASVHCTRNGKDRNDRIIGVCFASLPSGEIEINREMVASGWAFAYRKYSERYVETENKARLAKVGMWDSEVESPWEWRKKKKRKSR